MTLELVLLMIIGLSIGLMDSMQFHWTDSIPFQLGFNSEYWDPRKSWKNKYKKASELKFWAKLHIYYYDAWHTIKEVGVLIPMSLVVGLQTNHILLWSLIARLIIGLAFKLTYR